MNLPIKYMFWKRKKKKLKNSKHSPKVLPNGAIMIEYLEVLDSQDSYFYINSGISRGSDFQSVEVQSKLKFSYIHDRQIQGSEDRFYFGVYNGQWEWDYQRYTGTADTDIHVMKKSIAKVNGKLNMYAYLDDTLLGSDLTENWRDSFFKEDIGVFNYNDITGIGFRHSTRLYWEKIYYNGELVRDFIPVRVGDTGYLYDKVTELLFSNTGKSVGGKSAKFILGPDK